LTAPTNMPKEEKKIEEPQEPLKVIEPEKIIVPEPELVKSSNIEDDLGNQLTKSQKDELTGGGETTLHSHSYSLGFFGDGSDGDVTISTDTTLTRDMYYNNLTINAGVTLHTNGYRIFVKNNFINYNIVERNGNDGGDAAGLYNAGLGGAALSDNNLGGSGAGGNGGGYASWGAPGDSVSPAEGGKGNNGSNGGGTNPRAGGAGGSVTPPDCRPFALPFAALLTDYPSLTIIKGGAGGGGGGGSDNGAGGGGGSGGGVIFIAAKNLINYGSIEAKGGNGGLPYGYGGRGGGGGGGVIVLV